MRPFNVPWWFNLYFISTRIPKTVDRNQLQEQWEILASRNRFEMVSRGYWIPLSEKELISDMIQIAPEAKEFSVNAIIYATSKGLAKINEHMRVDGGVEVTPFSACSGPVEKSNDPAIFGVIDDGMPLFNRRFLRKTDQGLSTRFLASWLQQHSGEINEDGEIENGQPVQTERAAKQRQSRVRKSRQVTGMVLRRAEIDKMRCEAGESAAYRRLNHQLIELAEDELAQPKLEDGRVLPHLRSSTNQRFTHGSMVTDLACGVAHDRTDKDAKLLRKVDILGVQLASGIVRDSSGSRLRRGIQRGLRWIVREALYDGFSSGQRENMRPLIVNISVGAMAGPRASLLGYSRRINAEIEQYERISGRPMYVTISFGNAHRNRQLAHFNGIKAIKPSGKGCRENPAREGVRRNEESESGVSTAAVQATGCDQASMVLSDKPAVIGWRIQPDDRTPSLLQILFSLDEKTAKMEDPLKNVKIRITPPGIPKSNVNWIDVKPETSLSCGDIASYWTTLRTDFLGTIRLMAAVKVEPTASMGLHRKLERKTAPAGLWQIEIVNLWCQEENEDGTKASVLTSNGREERGKEKLRKKSEAIENPSPLEAVLRIQRDDTPPGYPAEGRQSYFTHVDAFEWDPETRDWTDPGQSPILRVASHADIAALDSRRSITAGSAFAPLEQGSMYTPARYSSAGSDTFVLSNKRGPDVSVIVDRSRFTPGVPAAGVMSRSVGRLSGTSAAAPLVARALLLHRSLPLGSKSDLGFVIEQPDEDEIERRKARLTKDQKRQLRRETADRARLGFALVNPAVHLDRRFD